MKAAGTLLLISGLFILEYIYKTGGVTETACFISGRPLELVLTCEVKHVIMVTMVIHGSRNTTTCFQPQRDYCAKKAMDRHMVMSQCMAQQSCLVHVENIWLAKCATFSNYISISYTCIAADPTSNSVADICGDSSMNQEIIRQTGYIESLSYPYSYLSDLHCQCNITTENDSQVVFEIMDMKMPPAPAFQSCIIGDWLEYTVDDQGWGEGNKLCSAKPGEKIYTGSNSASLNFYSDSYVETRGFWIKYSGMRPDGSPVYDMRVVCGIYSGPGLPVASTGLPINITQVDSNRTIPARAPSMSQPKLGYIVGFSAAILLVIVVALLVFVIYNVTRKRDENLERIEKKQMSPYDYGSTSVPSRDIHYSNSDTLTLHSDSTSLGMSMPSHSHQEFHNLAYDHDANYIPPADYPPVSPPHNVA